MLLHALPLLLRLILAEPALPAGATAPPVVVHRLDGRQTTVKLQGKPHLVVFFTTWCRGCPAYVSYIMRLREIRSGHIALVPVDVSASEAPEEPSELWHRIGRGRPLYLDRTGQVADAFHIQHLPAAVLVDQKGKVKGSLQGLQPRRAMAGLLRRAH